MTLHDEMWGRLIREADGLRDALHFHDREHEQFPDILDRSKRSSEETLEAAEEYGKAAKYTLVMAALQRIRFGIYGQCPMCRKQIPEKRLRAVPWAARCLECEESNAAE